VFKLLSDHKQPWKWWEYAGGFAEQCTMKNGRFADRCESSHLFPKGAPLSETKTCIWLLEGARSHKCRSNRLLSPLLNYTTTQKRSTTVVAHPCLQFFFLIVLVCAPANDGHPRMSGVRVLPPGHTVRVAP
jgi:hypothetical protein